MSNVEHSCKQIILTGHLIDSMYCVSIGDELPISPNLNGLSREELENSARVTYANRKRKIGHFQRDLRDVVSRIIDHSLLEHHMRILNSGDGYED